MDLFEHMLVIFFAPSCELVNVLSLHSRDHRVLRGLAVLRDLFRLLDERILVIGRSAAAAKTRLPLLNDVPNVVHACRLLWGDQVHHEQHGPQWKNKIDQRFASGHRCSGSRARAAPALQRLWW